MSGTTKMGYEGQIFYGTPGSTAGTQILNATDIDYNRDPERGDTTVRGDGSTIPIVTSKVTGLKPTITWKMLEKTGDTALADLLAAESTGAAIALRTKSHSAGKGYDGDVTLSVKHSMPIKGEQTYEFTAEATDDEGRVPQLWV